MTDGVNKRLVIGDVTRDWRPDLVLVNAGKPVVYYGPQVFRSGFEVDIAANDIALLPEAAPSLNHTLMVVNSTGLHALTGYSGGEYTVTDLGSSDWDGATRLTRGDLDDDGVLDLVGLSSGNELLFMEDVLATPDELDPVALYGTALDLVPVDWSGTGSMDVAVLTSTGMFVVEKDGDPVFWMFGPAETGRVARLTEDGLGFERVAVLWEIDDEQYLAVIDQNGLVETPLDVTELDVFSMTAGDFDGNGDDDLYLVSATSHASHVLYNQSSSESYTFGLASGEEEEIVLSGASVPGGWTPFPDAGDIDQDGDVDVATFLEASDEVVWLPNQSASPEAWQPVIYGGNYLYSWIEEAGYLQYLVEEPEAPPFASTHVQVMTFRVSSYSDLTTPMGAIVEHKLCNWNTVGETTLHLLFQEIEDDEDGVSINDLFISIVRLVRRSGGVIVEVGPSAAHAFATPAAITGDLSTLFANGVPIRPWEQGVPPPNEFEELGPIHQSERALAPKDVKINPAPPAEPPPDPTTFP